ncbi:MAG: peptidoglycan-binding protein [Actinomycetota bacterium]
MTPRPRLSRILAGTLTLALATVTSSVMIAPSAGASPQPSAGVSATGGDISWPQCPKGMGIPTRRSQGQPMPRSGAQFVVMGLTNGPGFYPNPCLAAQVAWVKARHLWAAAYSVITYPTPAQLVRDGGTGTLSTRLWRVGSAQAAFNVATMRAAGLDVPMVWVDVEPYRVAPWSKSPAGNNAVISGVLAGYKAAGLRTGIYSYDGGWKLITGSRLLPSLPTWVPVGPRGRSAAAARCAVKSFSGGPTWIAQWTGDSRDYDLTCPGITGQAAGGSILTPYLNTRLVLGSHGAAVAALQRRLGGLVADGQFGLLTRAKVVASQRSAGLPANGVVDSSVWRKLGAGSRISAKPSRMTSLFAST